MKACFVTLAFIATLAVTANAAAQTPPPKPTRTPIPTKPPKPSPTPASPFASFDGLCKLAAKLDDVERRAFNQKNDGFEVGPWRGRVENFITGDSVLFMMNLPNFKRRPLGDLRTVNLVFPTMEYQINEVYDFYGKFISVSSVGRQCIVNLEVGNREKQNVIVTP